MAVSEKLHATINRVLAFVPVEKISDFSKANPSALKTIREILVFSLLIILVFHIYMHSREGPFVFDDLHNILDNPHIRVTSLSWDSLKKAALESPIPSRWLVNVSFAINYYFNRYEPEGYRLVNVMVHLGNGLLLYLFLKSTFHTPGFLKVYRNYSHFFVPFAAVAIWLVNPLHTQSVSYIVQRMNSMATMFYLLAFLLYVRSRLVEPHSGYRWLLIGAGLLAYFMAIGCKENAITLPFFVLLYEWYFFRDLSFDWVKKNYLWFAVLGLFFVGMVILYIDENPLERVLHSYQFRDFTLGQRLMTQSRVVVFYIFLFLFPHPARLNLDHHFPLSHSLIDPPTTLLAILVLFLLLATAWMTARKAPLLSFCIFWFLGNLVIESSVIGLELVFEHRTYLPTILFSSVMVITLYRVIKWKWVRRAAIMLVLVLGATWTHERNRIWADEIALWDDTIKKSPGKVRPYVNMGIAHKERGQFEKAIHYLQQAVQLEPDYVKAHYNLSISHLSRGDARQAEEHASVAQRLNPNDPDTVNALGIAIAQQGRLDEAIEAFSQALQLDPKDSGSHYNLSLALANAGQVSKARIHCMEALRLKPDYKEAIIHLKELQRRLELHRPRLAKPFGKNIVNLQ